MLTNIIKNIAQKLLPICQDQWLAEQEAWWLLESITHKSKAELIIGNITLTQEQQEKLDSLVARRVNAHEPLQYIVGSVPFCGLTIDVKSPILIPRPETEEWVTWVINQYKEVEDAQFTVLDLCTGSGCIALALAKSFPKATIIGVDLNPQAIRLANINKEKNNITNCSFITSDLYQKLPGNFTCNLIVSNPPYLTREEYQDLDPSVKIWEDRSALVADNNGMFFYHKILQEAPLFLRPIKTTSPLPNIIFEIGPAQEPLLSSLLTTGSIRAYTIHKDLQGKNRWLALVVAL